MLQISNQSPFQFGAFHVQNIMAQNQFKCQYPLPVSAITDIPGHRFPTYGYQRNCAHILEKSVV